MGLVGKLAILLAVPAALALAGCGGSTKSAGPAPVTTAPAAPTPAATTASQPTATGPAPALQAEIVSAAAGDIPDNQVFLTFRNRPAAYSMKYPEGWAQQGAGSSVTFRDKNNVVRVLVVRAARPTLAAVSGGRPVVKVSYSTVSAPNPVTGKRVTLVVDRYYLSRADKEAVVDLGTPQGVDNVDAYRLMIQSFRWR
jgi:hypothetical protein